MTLLQQLPELERYRYFAKDEFGLDAFPHIVENLKTFWGYEEFYGYVNNLLVTDRDRVGFPVNVILELDKVVEVHRALFPDLKAPPIATQDNYRF